MFMMVGAHPHFVPDLKGLPDGAVRGGVKC